VQSDELMTHEVLAWCDARRDRERDFALVCDQTVDTPLAVRAETVFVDLEPLEASDGERGGVGHLREVGDDGALVRGVDRVRGVGGTAIEGVVPLGGELSTDGRVNTS
jgi:hypothetical protein